MDAAALPLTSAGQVPPVDHAAAGRYDTQALQDRAARFRARLGERVPHQICPPDRPGAALLGRLLGLLVGEVAPAPDGRLALHRTGLPPVMLDPGTLQWSCAAGHAEGAGLVEAAAWLADQPTGAMAALLGLACRIWARDARG